MSCHACKLGCEGIVSKGFGSPYISGRTRRWLKFENPAAPAVRQEAKEDWSSAAMALILKRASRSRPSGEWKDEDYDVLADGRVVGHILERGSASTPAQLALAVSAPLARAYSASSHGRGVCRQFHLRGVRR